MLDPCNHDLPTFYRDKLVNARKTHICCECGRDIIKKEKYSYVTGLWDGLFSCFKTCQHCLSAQSIFNQTASGYISHAQLSECIYDDMYNFKQKHTKLTKCYIGIKRKWRRFNSDNLMNVPS